MESMQIANNCPTVKPEKHGSSYCILYLLKICTQKCSRTHTKYTHTMHIHTQTTLTHTCAHVRPPEAMDHLFHKAMCVSLLQQQRQCGIPTPTTWLCYANHACTCMHTHIQVYTYIHIYIFGKWFQHTRKI